MSKQILVVAHDRPLRTSRVALLAKAGYKVTSVASDDEAMALLEAARFDLILIGWKSLIPKIGLDQRLREKYPDLLTLKIVGNEPEYSVYPSRLVDAEPAHVLAALHEMIGTGLRRDTRSGLIRGSSCDHALIHCAPMGAFRTLCGE